MKVRLFAKQGLIIEDVMEYISLTVSKKRLLALCLFCMATLVWSCGGSSDKKVAVADANGVVNLVVNSTDLMRYDTRELRVSAGAKVALTLNHTGTMGKKMMGHNLVILKSGTRVDDFASRALDSPDTDYIPAGDEILVHTRLLGGGESDTITFDAPDKGSYLFICTFPGHYTMMRGSFIVE